MLKTLLKNTFFLSLSQIFGRLIGFVYFVILARILGVKAFGTYTFIISFIYSFIPVADFGLEKLILKEISRFPEKAQLYFSRLFPIRIAFALFAYILAIILGLVLGLSGQELTYLLIFGLILIPTNLIFFFTSFFNSREKMEYQAIAGLILVLLTAVFGIGFASLGFSLPVIFLAYPLANLIVVAFFLLNLKKWHFSLDWKIDFSFLKDCLSSSWAFAFLTILAVFYLRLSTIVLSLIKGSEAVGLYQSAFKFIEAGILIPYSFTLALFPLSSKMFLTDKRRLLSVYFKSLGILFILALPFFGVMFFLPELLIKLSYGGEFLPAVKAFQILGISMILFFVNSLAGNVIINSEKYKKFLPLSLINFLVALILLLLLVPRFSFIGAAWAVVGGEIFGLVVNNWFVYKILKS